MRYIKIYLKKTRIIIAVLPKWLILGLKNKKADQEKEWREMWILTRTLKISSSACDILRHFHLIRLHLAFQQDFQDGKQLKHISRDTLYNYYLQSLIHIKWHNTLCIISCTLVYVHHHYYQYFHCFITFCAFFPVPVFYLKKMQLNNLSMKNMH